MKVSVDRVDTSISFTRWFRKPRKPKETKLSKNGTEHVNNLTPEKIKKKEVQRGQLANWWVTISLLAAVFIQLFAQLGGNWKVD